MSDSKSENRDRAVKLELGLGLGLGLRLGLDLRGLCRLRRRYGAAVAARWGYIRVRGEVRVYYYDWTLDVDGQRLGLGSQG